MPIAFESRRIRFGDPGEPDTGGPLTKVEKFQFPSTVRKAVAVINGFHAGYKNEEHPLALLEVNTHADIDVEDKTVVSVRAILALRDNSGNFDDDYGGFIDVVVLVDRA
jgi:hypothetical protein